MFEEDLVSCIVLSYKNFDYIYQTLDSILEQNYPSIEIILCDDCSDNFPRKDIEEYIKLKSRDNILNVIIFQLDKNVGTVVNFNTAIKMSKGNYICPLSSDDLFIEDNTISKIVSFFKKNNSIIATAYRDVYSQDLEEYIEKLPTEPSSLYNNLSPDDMFKKLCLGNFISGACTYYTKAFFEKYGLFDESYLLLEDYPKYLSFVRSGGVMGFIDFSTIKYRMGGISTSSSKSLSYLNDFSTLLKKEITPYKKK